MDDTQHDDMPTTEEEWKQRLTPEQYKVLRERGTEAPYSGKYVEFDEEGSYNCQACGNPLFSSDTKFESKEPGLRGWPSFDDALPGAIRMEEDTSLGMRRTEILCAKCGSHLGHVFDGVSDSKNGKHYCVNSACLNFQEK